MMNNLLSPGRWSASATDWASLILRIACGGFMLTHGWPKMQKMLAGDYGFADPIGIGESASLMLTVFAEVLCAVLVLVGLWLRPALIPLIITMLVAAGIVHGSDPFGDKEHSLMYLFGYAALFLLGSGRFSLDALMRKD